MVPTRIRLETATRVEDDRPATSPVVRLECGAYHTVALTAAGHVFTFGLGPAVGRGKPQRDKTLADGDDDRPCRVRDLDDVVWVGCGHSFTAALTFDGDLYLWGEGDVLGDGFFFDAAAGVSRSATKPGNAGSRAADDAREACVAFWTLLGDASAHDAAPNDNTAPRDDDAFAKGSEALVAAPERKRAFRSAARKVVRRKGAARRGHRDVSVARSSEPVGNRFAGRAFRAESAGVSRPREGRFEWRLVRSRKTRKTRKTRKKTVAEAFQPRRLIDGAAERVPVRFIRRRPPPA